MNKKLPYLFIALFLSFCNTIFSQEKHILGPNEFFVMHYYTFEGVAGQDKLDELEQTLLNLDYVSEAKVKYKNEKSMGQVILITKEKPLLSERDKGFSPTIIKKTIINMGLSPIQYTSEKKSSK
jgi:hypothetical protein